MKSFLSLLGVCLASLACTDGYPTQDAVSVGAMTPAEHVRMLNSYLGDTARGAELRIALDGPCRLAVRDAAAPRQAPRTPLPLDDLQVRFSTDPATGRYLVFADSDDLVPDGAYRAMLDSLESSGSDMAIGDHLKFSATETWSPTKRWYPFDRALIGVAPDEVPELRTEVLAWMAAMESVGQQVLNAMAIGLGLPAGWFRQHLTADPTVLFRIFRYPPHPEGDGAASRWGVAEHTDYGLLTLLAHDGTPGLEVRVGSDWIAVDPDPDLLVCNLGDMLDRLTLGRYRSTPPFLGAEDFYFDAYRLAEWIESRL